MIIDPDAVEYQQAATVTETLAEVYHLLTESSDSEDLGRLISARVPRRPLVKEPIEDGSVDVYLSKQSVRYSPMLRVNSDS